MRIKIWILSKILDQRIYPLIKDDACDGVTTFESTFSRRSRIKDTLNTRPLEVNQYWGGGGGVQK